MFSKDAEHVNVMDEFMNGTFDNKKTNCREVWVNGILAINHPVYVLECVRDGLTGQKLAFSPFGEFPDNPNNL